MAVIVVEGGPMQLLDKASSRAAVHAVPGVRGQVASVFLFVKISFRIPCFA